MASNNGKRLAPAKRLRLAVPRNCGTCKFGTMDDGVFSCRREGGYQGDVGDGLQNFFLCDGYENNIHFNPVIVQDILAEAAARKNLNQSELDLHLSQIRK